MATLKCLSQMTLQEKLLLMAGESTWRTAPIPRLGVPKLKVSDGPSGARGEIFGESVPAAFFPSGVSLGAAWDVDLMYEIGQAIAEETKTKSASVILAPTMCVHRHPLSGRNFESFSEDPFLTGQLASAHVKGIQSRGIGATPKHFVANDEETNRFKYNAVIPERALREVYLLPFQMAVRDADPWCMMSAYNKVNGNHCDSSKELLDGIVRDEWGWKGVMMSDWGGTNTTVEAINAGLDLEFPGPPVRRSSALLRKALSDNLINLGQVNKSADRLLRLLHKTGRFELAPDDPEYCKDDEKTRGLLLRAATEGIKLKRIAVLGPNAKRVVAGGGGSSYINAPYWTNVHDSLQKAFRDSDTHMLFAGGAKVHRYLPTASLRVLTDPICETPGAAVEWYLGHDLSGAPTVTTHIDDLYYVCFGTTPPGIGVETDYGFRVRSTLRPLTSGRHQLSLASIDPSNMTIDGKIVATQSGSIHERAELFFQYGSSEKRFYLELIEGQAYEIEIEYLSHDRQLHPAYAELMLPMEDKFQGIRFGYKEQEMEDLLSNAAALAADCDAAVIVVGRDKEWETEGHDIPIFELPGQQVRLIQEVSKVCNRFIVVIQAGTPVEMTEWIDDVQGVLYTWYQGQELGNAAAAILTGSSDATGRLSITFPRRIQDCPAFSSFPGEHETSTHSEGVFVGYRWWDLVETAPLFPIGHCLSYNTFAVDPTFISAKTLYKNTKLLVTVRVKNLGGFDKPGRQTVILWLAPKGPTRLRRPKKQICAFAKSGPLLAGESSNLDLEMDAYAFGVFDTKKRKWVVDAKTQFDVLVGTTAMDAFPIWVIGVPEKISWVHEKESDVLKQ
ncbi:Beta-glucosidase B [Paramyrothecium foliicola]|nr:Beta-glucosidase B [Paramyrothecium foliicola]